MKRFVVALCVGICIFGVPSSVLAQRGCCSWHGGVVGCGENGKQLCADGTYSPSCTCTPPPVYGCTDPNAINYNPKANTDNGSCIARVYGCMDTNSINYNAFANTADGSCQYERIETRTEEIPYDTNRESYSNVRIEQEGVKGEKEVTERKIVGEDGTVISSEVIEEKVIREPVSEIVVEVPDTMEEEKVEEEPSQMTQTDVVGWVVILGGIGSYILYRKMHPRKQKKENDN